MSVFILPAALVISLAATGSWLLRTRRRKHLQERPIPAGWKEIIAKNVELYRRLPSRLKDELHGHLQVLLAEKNFEGAGGLTLTEEMKVTIAAQAAILLLNRKPTYFPQVDSIVVYPSAYIASQKRRDGFIETNEASVRLGESWQRGVVVLAWDHVRSQALDISGGHNVVLHEFAHQLDQESGASTGTPRLEHRSSYATWGRVMNREFEELRRKVAHHVSDVMDVYGATNPAEFFAVATESFFDKPHELKAAHPKLYALLADYYKLDPAAW